MTRNELAFLVAAVSGAMLLSACDRPQAQSDAAKERPASIPESPKTGPSEMRADSSSAQFPTPPVQGQADPRQPEQRKDFEPRK